MRHEPSTMGELIEQIEQDIEETPPPPIINVNEAHRESSSLFDRAADAVTDCTGSWPFLLLHLVWFALWIVLRIEPFPFGLLTMIVSLEAIVLSTLVMMSQNRQVAKDRLTLERDYLMDQHTAERIDGLWELVNQVIDGQEDHEHLLATILERVETKRGRRKQVDEAG